MLHYANPIRFEDDFVLPSYSLDTLYDYRAPDDFRYDYNRTPYRAPKPRPTSLLNNQGQFFVNVSEKAPYVKELVRQAQNLNLTVSGDGTSPVRGGDITQARKGDQITFGSSSRFDVNWTKRDQYFCQKGFAPVYDIVKDWNKIEKAMKQFANDKRSIRTTDGTNVRFHSRFMVVDGKVIPYNRNEIAVIMPAQVLRDLVCEYELVAIRTLRQY